MPKTRFMLIAAMALLPAVAHGNNVPPCVSSTTLDNILGSTCTIGGETYAFASNLVPFPGAGSLLDLTFVGLMSPDGITFTTDVSSPNGPGFILTGAANGPFYVSSSRIVGEQFALDYEVSVTHPSSGALLIGTTLTTVGAQVQNTVFGNVDVEGGGLSVFVSAGTRGGPGTVTVGAALGPGVSSFSTEAAILLVEANDVGVGYASLTSAEFNVAESTTTPEPSSVLLFGTGIIGIMGAMRRKLFGWL